MTAALTLVTNAPPDGLDLLAEKANTYHHQSQDVGRMSLEFALKAGEALIEAKAQVEHGKWLPWLEKNFEASERHAERYMKLARNSTRVSNLMDQEPDLAIRSALKAIAKPPNNGDDDNPAPHAGADLLDLYKSIDRQILQFGRIATYDSISDKHRSDALAYIESLANALNIAKGHFNGEL